MESERDEYTESGIARDFRGSSALSGYSRGQTVLFTDLISEGPIHGLVCGGNSIWLNGDPAQTEAQASCFSSTGPRATISGNEVTLPSNSKEINTEFGTNSGVVRNAITRTISTATSADPYLGSRRYNLVLNTQISTDERTLMRRYGIEEHDGSNSNLYHTARIVRNEVVLAQGYIDFPSGRRRPSFWLKEGTIDETQINSWVGATLAIDIAFEVDSISTSASRTVLESSDLAAVSNGNYPVDINGPVASRATDIDSTNNSTTYPNFAYEFRAGNLLQEPFRSPPGTGLGNVALGPGTSFSSSELSKHSDGSGTPIRRFSLTGATGFGIRQNLVQSVAELRITFSYAALHNTRVKDGENLRGTVWHKISINGEEVLSKPHIANSTGTVIFQEKIRFYPEKYKNTSDITVEVERLTFNDTAVDEGKMTTNAAAGEYTTNSPCAISSISSILKENLNYPHSAIAKVQVGSKSFNAVPIREYHSRGLLIKVPSNYVTREESANGIAQYSGNFSGEFRDDLVYCNNPAWILWDIITNNRYGLGNWIEPSDLNIYAFYKVARFCDELVPALVGDSSMEPRFTTNVYLRTATEAYKVVKDLASIFTGILYWMDGQVSPIADTREYPVYVFNPSNIIDGSISYETTGTRTKANQVVVTWNNPDNNYKLEPLVVEDQEDISSTGQIITDNALAFGATSYGQALRYGRWKLWTARNQTEILSFQTAINATFLQPGDIVVVPKYTNTTFNGRIIDVDTVNGRVRIDKFQELINAGYDISTMECIIVLNRGIAKSTETTSFEHNEETIEPGGMVPGIQTNVDAFNFTDDSGTFRSLQWMPNTYTETLSNGRTIDKEEGWFDIDGDYNTSIVGAVWATEHIGNNPLTNKEYKILGIVEDDANTYTITAVEYFREKFDSIDDRFILNVADPIYKIPSPSLPAPPPRNVYVTIGNLNSGKFNDDVTLYYDPPVNQDGTDYDFVGHYEVEHAIPGLPNPFIINKDLRTVQGLDITPGTHTIGMRTVSSYGTRSTLVKTTFVVRNPAIESVPRRLGIPLGATVSSRPILDDTSGSETFSTGRENWAISPAGNPDLVNQYPDILTQDISGLVSKEYSTLTDNEKAFDSGYIFYDSSDSTDPLKLLLYADNYGVQYLYDAGNGVETGDGFTEINSAITISAGSVKVVGSDFTTNYEIGDTLKLTAGSDIYIAKVAYIVDDNDMRIDRTIKANNGTAVAINDSTPGRLNIRPNRDNDCIFAQIRNNDGVFEWFPINLIIDQFLGAGVGRELIFARTESETAPSVPSNGWGFSQPDPAPNPVGSWVKSWHSSAPTLGPVTVGQDTTYYYYLWESSRRIEGAPADGENIEAEWSTPIIVSHWGRDGSNAEFVYRRTTNSTAPVLNQATVDSTVAESLPTSWTDDPTGVDINNRYEWVATRAPLLDGSGNWSDYSTPALWAKYGVDGDSSEFVYRATNTDTVDPIDSGDITRTAYQVNEFVPTNWSDDAPSPTEDNPYVWVSQRDKVNESWAAFKAPSLWSRWGEGPEGVRGQRIANGYIYWVGTDTTTAPPAPSETGVTFNYGTGHLSGLPTNWAEEPLAIEPGTRQNTWYVYWTATETGEYDSDDDTYTIEINFEDVSMGVQFSGLVTFSNTNDGVNLAGDGTTLTEINGGNIKTDTITLDSLKSGTFFGVGGTDPGNRFTIGTPASLRTSGFSGTKGSLTDPYNVVAYFEAEGEDFALGCLQSGTTAAGIDTGETDAAYAFGALSSSGKVACFYYRRGASSNHYDVCIGEGTNAIQSPGFSVTNTGTVTSLNTSATSDRRLKFDIKRIENALDKVGNLSGYTYEMKGEKRAGIIAQELQEVLPVGVGKTDDDYLTISIPAVLGLLVGAVNELKQEVKRLKNGSS